MTRAMTMRKVFEAVSYADELTRVCPPGGTVAHLSRDGDLLCPDRPGRDWTGTGSQEEYEHAAGLPLCAGCRRTAEATGVQRATETGGAQ